MSQNPLIEDCVDNFIKGVDAEENFRRIYNYYRPKIHRFFSRKGFSKENSDELTHETFLSIYKGLGGFQKKSPFENWLFAITNNVYRRQIERQKAEKRAGKEDQLIEEHSDNDEQPKPSQALIAPGLSPSEELIEKEQLKILREAIQELPEQQRRCIQLRLIQDLSYQEIADLMGIKLNTVKAHLHQGKEALRKKLQ